MSNMATENFIDCMQLQRSPHTRQSGKLIQMTSIIHTQTDIINKSMAYHGRILPDDSFLNG